MIGIVIVCTHDAVKVAETLARLLAAEEHVVRLCYGRQSLDEIEVVRGAKDAVLLIWSVDAPSAHYMLQWQKSVDPTRLVEIARAPGAPKHDQRVGPVIDFSSWRLSDRGGRAWNNLLERLRVVERAMEPPRPPPRRAAIALGLVSAAAVGGAVFVRVNDVPQAPTLMPQSNELAEGESFDGVGGPLRVIEPPSAEDLVMQARSYPRAQLLSPADYDPLAPVPETPEFELRQQTLLGRLGEITAPLLGPRNNDERSEE
jgi:hypothetical protein